MKDLSQQKPVPAHGRAGVSHIVKFACDRQTTGTCDMTYGSEGLTEGAPEQVFGRLVSMTPIELQPSQAALQSLGDLMAEDEASAAKGPAAAGIAFLGQFIDHDVTLDATTKLGQVAGAVDKIRNFRTPTLDLDCVYGDGPEVDPWLYDKDDGLIFGTKSNDQDLQRNRRGTALIGDPRNDENLFVSQVHGRMFVAKHNALIAPYTKANPDKKSENYQMARAELTRQYHLMILEEFLPQVVDDGVLAPLLAQATNLHLEPMGRVHWDMAPAMPVEFSAAAYRFGHSLVRETYDLNAQFKDVRLFGKDGDSVALNGFDEVDAKHNLDMDLFFGAKAQPARPIDTKLPAALITLPDSVAKEDKNLAARNMIRGQRTFKLPSGESMAQCMGVDVIDPDDKIKDAGLQGNTPLWYYCLMEAEKHGGKLGAVGGGLVAGVLLNLMIKAGSPVLRPYRGV